MMQNTQKWMSEIADWKVVNEALDIVEDKCYVGRTLSDTENNAIIKLANFIKVLQDIVVSDGLSEERVMGLKDFTIEVTERFMIHIKARDLAHAEQKWDAFEIDFVGRTPGADSFGRGTYEGEYVDSKIYRGEPRW